MMNQWDKLAQDLLESPCLADMELWDYNTNEPDHDKLDWIMQVGSTGEKALVELARDIWLGIGPFTHLLDSLDAENVEWVLASFGGHPCSEHA